MNGIRIAALIVLICGIALVILALVPGNTMSTFAAASGGAMVGMGLWHLLTARR